MANKTILKNTFDLLSVLPYSTVNGSSNLKLIVLVSQAERLAKIKMKVFGGFASSHV